MSSNAAAAAVGSTSTDNLLELAVRENTAGVSKQSKRVGLILAGAQGTTGGSSSSVHTAPLPSLSSTAETSAMDHSLDSSA